jgi:hypothetical protein
VRTILFILLLAMASAALAQISPEEAQRRLDERRAQASTRPMDTSVIPDLKFEIARLQKEIARLKAENAALTERAANAEAAAAAAAATIAAAPAIPSSTQPAAAPATEPALTAPVSTKPPGSLRLGMTLLEANAAMGFDGTLVGEGRGWQQYQWPLPTKSRPESPSSTDRPPRTLLGGDNAAAGPSIFARFEGGSLTSYAKR